jgi:hypothetical protein
MQLKRATAWEVIDVDEDITIAGQKPASPNGGTVSGVQSGHKINRGGLHRSAIKRACGQCVVLGLAARERLEGEVGATPAALAVAFEQPFASAFQGAGLYARVAVRGAQAHSRGLFPARCVGAGAAGHPSGGQPVVAFALLCGFQLSGGKSALLPAIMAVVCGSVAVAP